MRRWKQTGYGMTALLLWLTAGTVRGDWPTYEEAGFHHAALIYQRETRRMEEFKPMIARHRRDTGQFEPQGVFDCFLFLDLHVNGIRTENGKTHLKDWQLQLEQWFTPEREVDALHRAVLELKQEFGGKLPQQLTVIFSIPYMHPAVTDFGDVDGDGISESFADPEGVRKVAEWYITTIEEKMQTYPELKLLGFYWMNESVRKDEQTLKIVSGILKERGLRFIWIPWFRAAGWERWRDFGFDCALMQSNYAFTSYSSGKTSRRNRLDLCADLARSRGLGIEIEFPHRRDAEGIEIIRQTYDAGSRLGFQQVPAAYYLGSEFKEYASPDPAVRQVYDWTCDYIAGKDMRISTKTVRINRHDSGEVLAEMAWQSARPIHYLDLLLEEPPENPWRGFVVVEGQKAPDAAWEPLVWHSRKGADPANGRFQNITLPIFADVTALRARMIPAEGATAPRLTGVWPDAVTPAVPPGKTEKTEKGKSGASSLADYAYPDNAAGRKLLDGQTSGGWGAYLGWQNAPLGVMFDLGPGGTEWGEVRVHARREPGAAIAYPLRLSLYAFGKAPEKVSGGPGALPEQAVMAGMPKREMTRNTPDGKVQESMFVFRFNRPLRQRYVALEGDAVTWVFLSEVEFFCHGQRLPSKSIRYRITAPLKQRELPREP